MLPNFCVAVPQTGLQRAGENRPGIAAIAGVNIVAASPPENFGVDL